MGFRHRCLQWVDEWGRLWSGWEQEASQLPPEDFPQRGRGMCFCCVGVCQWSKLQIQEKAGFPATFHQYSVTAPLLPLLLKGSNLIVVTSDLCWNWLFCRGINLKLVFKSVLYVSLEMEIIWLRLGVNAGVNLNVFAVSLSHCMLLCCMDCAPHSSSFTTGFSLHAAHPFQAFPHTLSISNEFQGSCSCWVNELQKLWCQRH